MEPIQGATVGGVYVFERLLGEGGMGAVWAASVRGTNERVALKVIRAAAVQHRARFEREALATSSVAHPNVRSVREVVEWGGAPVMVMDLLEGVGLGARIERDGRLGPSDVSTILAQLVSAVGALHEAGIVHRDLKPENIFLVDDSSEKVKVLDFGIAKIIDPIEADAAHASTLTGDPIGTPYYMAPEQLLGEPTADDRVDVWAIGIIAYFLLSGVLPTEADNLGQVMKRVLLGAFPSLLELAPQTEPRLAGLVMRALLPSPDGRPSLHEFSEALARSTRVDVPTFGQSKARRAIPTPFAPTLLQRDICPTAVVARHNLPRVATTFIGRRASVDELRRLARVGALVTLTGAAGSGKTRLAIEVAGGLLGVFTGGVWFVDLGRVAAGSRVDNAVFAAIPPSSGKPSFDARVAEIATQGPTLVVMDNCEHVVESASELVDSLLAACPDVCVLATSREALSIAGEETFSVSPLETPDGTLASERILGFESVALFVDRARLADRSMVLESQDIPLIADVCRRLDGLPLAIELAAARVHVLGLAELARRVSEHLELLSNNVRGATPRHRTLRAAISWSHSLLSDEERRVHRALAVFEGSFGLPAALAVATSDEREERGARAIDLLSRLVRRSIVNVERQAGEPRFRLLETVRSYAREELARLGEAEDIAERHATFHVAEAERSLSSGRIPVARGDLEIDDFLSADRHASARENGSTRSLTIALGLEEYLKSRGQSKLGCAWVDRILTTATDLDERMRVRGLNTAASFRIFSGATEAAKPLATAALAAAEALADDALLGDAHNNVGLVADRLLDFESAEQSYLAALVCFRRASNGRRAAVALNNLGDIAFARGDVALALERQKACLEHIRHVGDTYVTPFILSVIALLSTLAHSDADAPALVSEAVAIVRATRALRASADVIEAAVYVAERAGDRAPAIRWYAAAEALRARSMSPTEDYYVVQHHATVARARAALGEDASREAREAGARLEPTEALDEIAAWLARTFPVSDGDSRR